MAAVKREKDHESHPPFPAVGYLDHSFSLMPHPIIPKLRCVAREGVAVTNAQEADWLLARRLGVTASGFGDLVTRAGTPSKSRTRAVRAKVLGIEKDISFVSAIELGNRYEEVIAERIHKIYGVKPNHWLVAEEETPRFLATPDGLSPNLVAEYKTSVKSWGHNLHTYYRQIQWQLFVTNREQAVFATMHPVTQKLLSGIVPRDEAEIDLLRSVALEVLAELDAYSETEDFQKSRAAREEVLESTWPGDDWVSAASGALPF